MIATLYHEFPGARPDLRLLVVEVVVVVTVVVVVVVVVVIVKFLQHSLQFYITPHDIPYNSFLYSIQSLKISL